MRTALVGVDGVGEGVHALAVAAVPLHRDLEGQALLLVLGLEVDHRGVHRVSLAGVEVLHEVDDAALVVVRDGLDLVLLVAPASSAPAVAFADSRSSVSLIVKPLLRNAISWKRRESVSKEYSVVSKMSAVGPEGDRGAGLLGGLVLGQRGRRDAQLVVLRPAVAVGPDLDRDLAWTGR